MLDELNAMRAVLVAMAGVAAIVALSLGYILPGLVLALGVTLHLVHFGRLYREYKRGQPPSSES